MNTVSTIAELRAALAPLRTAERSVGFVPTMGALHDGHRSLLLRSVAENDVTVASIFVNPLQFGSASDLQTYPRDLDADLKVAAEAGVDLVLAPSVDEMYPGDLPQTSVAVSDLGDTLEGLVRPGHFDGVATVVTKLFSIVGECRAYFGEKDWQQLAVVKQIVRDLSLPVEVIGCETVREHDGLAMSSRNARLGDDERKAAAVLSKALRAARTLIESGMRMPLPVIASMTHTLSTEPLVRTEYATVIDNRFRLPDALKGDVRLVVAARIGSTRLIDNMGAVA